MVQKQRHGEQEIGQQTPSAVEEFQFSPTWTWHENFTRAVCVTTSGNLITQRIYGINITQYVNMTGRSFRPPTTCNYWVSIQQDRGNTLPIQDVSNWLRWDCDKDVDLGDKSNHLMWIVPMKKSVLRGLFKGMCVEL